MRIYIFLSIIVLGLACQTSNHNGNKVNKMSQKKDPDSDLKCDKLSKYSSEELKMLFPFKDAKSVRLASFKQPQDDSISEDIHLKDRVIEKFYSKNDKGESKFDSSKVYTKQWYEFADLEGDDKVELSNIFFNYGFKKQPDYEIVSQCYLPRNALLFYNSNGQVYSAIEICFECERIEVYPNTLDIGDWCSEKINMIRSFFIKHGIKYGTIENK